MQEKSLMPDHLFNALEDNYLQNYPLNIDRPWRSHFTKYRYNQRFGAQTVLLRYQIMCLFTFSDPKVQFIASLVVSSYACLSMCSTYKKIDLLFEFLT